MVGHTDNSNQSYNGNRSEVTIPNYQESCHAREDRNEVGRVICLAK